jgi:hypothetical protein
MNEEKKLRLKNYEFYLENPFFNSNKLYSSYDEYLFDLSSASFRFMDFFEKPLENFSKGINENEVIKFYKTNPYLLSGAKRDVCKINGNYFSSNGGYILANKCGTKGIHIIQMIRIKPEKFETIAHHNLLSTIDEELTLGDKLIIKKIAKDVFYHTLDSALNDEIDSNFGMTLFLMLNEAALAQLDKYGFKHENERILNVKLKI